jgi:hypothetical protein
MSGNGYLVTGMIPPPIGNNTPRPKAVGIALTATGTTPWVPIYMVPNIYFAQIFGTSGASTATCRFEFSDDGISLAGKGSTLSLSGTGTGATVVADADHDKSVSPWSPWKFVRLNVTAISGTGAKVAGFQALGTT